MSSLLPQSQYRELVLPQGTIHYYDAGAGPTLVFVHGLLVNSALWRRVIPLLTPHFRCIAPDLPLGAHSLPFPEAADVSPRGVAQVVIDLLEALDLHDVTLVGNDTGGAICQLVIAQRPPQVTRLILTNCDAFEAFFPWMFQWLHHAARIFGIGFARTLARVLSARVAQRGLMATVSRSRYDDSILDAYLGPMLRDDAVRRDLTRFLQQVSNRDTLAAATTFPSFAHPVHLVWGTGDPLFPLRLAKRLQQTFPNATLELVARSRAFVPEDQPDVLAGRIHAFLHMDGPVAQSL